jgi:hypothetical protein
MAVTQTADKITTVMTAVTPEMAGVGMEIRKGMLKLQNADGKTEGMALTEAIMMMTGGTAAAHLGAVIMRMTTESMDARADGLHITTMKTVVEIIHAVVVAIMMTAEVPDMVDGSVTLRVTQRQHARAGKTGEAIAVVVITTEVIAAAVEMEAAIAMMIATMIRVGVGMAILKVIPKQPTEVGKIVDIKKSAKVKSQYLIIATFFFVVI